MKNSTITTNSNWMECSSPTPQIQDPQNLAKSSSSLDQSKTWKWALTSIEDALKNWEDISDQMTNLENQEKQTAEKLFNHIKRQIQSLS